MLILTNTHPPPSHGYLYMIYDRILQLILHFRNKFQRFLSTSRTLILNKPSVLSCLLCKQNVSHQSKILRNVIMMTKFNEKMAIQTIPLPFPKPLLALSFCPQPTIEITITPKQLLVVKLQEINIRPKKIYHPSIITACECMFEKLPDNLSKEEIDKFNQYRKYKSKIGDPLEANPIYIPMCGLGNCLICANLT
jgi:hypothetical protein